jgi:hypothetical protein
VRAEYTEAREELTLMAMTIYINHKDYIVKVKKGGNVRIATAYAEDDTDFDLGEMSGEAAILLGVALIDAGKKALA